MCAVLQLCNRLFSQLELQCGWTEDVIEVVRSLLSTLFVKIAGSGGRWKTLFDMPEWHGLFKVRLFSFSLAYCVRWYALVCMCVTVRCIFPVIYSSQNVSLNP